MENKKLNLMAVLLISSVLSTNVMAFHGRGCHLLSGIKDRVASRRAARQENREARRSGYSYADYSLKNVGRSVRGNCSGLFGICR